MQKADALFRLLSQLAQTDYPPGAYVEVSIIRWVEKVGDFQHRYIEDPIRFSLDDARRAVVSALSPPENAAPSTAAKP